jgi:hypothetical protein
MERRRRTKSRAQRVIRLWTRVEAVRALPYLRSLTKSLRDHWLAVQSHQVDIRRMDKIGRPTRQQIIAREEAQNDLTRAEDQFNEALAELMQMDVFLLDPVQGHALIPFQQGEDLAWYVFDLFDEQGLPSWRYHKDPLDTRRPIPLERSVEPPLTIPTLSK